MKFKWMLIITAFIGFCGRGTSGAQTPTRPDQDVSSEEIIHAFAAKETEFYEAWKQYSYRQTTEVRIISINGSPSRERIFLVSDIVFNDDGTREVKMVRRSGELRSVLWTREDAEVINNLQPFALTAKDLPLYNLKYEGKEKIDELNCYFFSVKPKSTKGGKLYFQGKIWVDDVDLQIVRTVGIPVPQKRQSQYPQFETIRQMIDDKYWFPTWTHADSVLKFDQQNVHIEETINYENYKRFGSTATIEFPPAKP